MKRKVMDVSAGGYGIVCIHDEEAKRNPYKLYRVWYDRGKHQKKITEYDNFASVAAHLWKMAVDGDVPEWYR